VSVAKVIEVVGNSPKAWEDATRVAVAEAGKTVRNIRGVEVVGMTGVVKDGKIAKYRSTVKVAFEVER
jgi:flavin-binding protein dodecin